MFRTRCQTRRRKLSICLFFLHIFIIIIITDDHSKRMGMAHLLGQLSLPPNPSLALPLLHRAALLASLTCPQPAYVYALLLLNDFTLPSLPSSLLHPSIFAPFIPLDSSPHLEARKHLERAAFLHFSPAQYKLGHAYEFAEPPFPFHPILSVQYYSLASQQGESEADMALSKWFLCGSGGAASSSNSVSPIGGFEKDETLALHFASKAASKSLPSALFAMGYYAEVGVGQPKDVNKARDWYRRAVQSGNEDASERLRALDALLRSHTATPTQSGGISREEHERLTESRLIRRRTLAQQRMANEPISPPWDGKVFPTLLQEQNRGYVYTQGDGTRIVETIRKNSLKEKEGDVNYDPTPQSQSQPQPRGRSQSPRALPPQPQPVPVKVPLQPRYPWGDNVPGPLSAPLPHSNSDSSPNSRTTSRNASPTSRPYSLLYYGTDGSTGRKVKTPPPPMGGRERSQSPAPVVPGRGAGAKAGRMRLNLNDEATVSTPTSAIPAMTNTTTTTTTSNSTPTPLPPSITTTTVKPLTPNRAPAQTFAEMGVFGAKVEEKECVIM